MKDSKPAFWLKMMTWAIVILGATFLWGGRVTVDVFGHEMRVTSLLIAGGAMLFIFGSVFGTLAVIAARIGAIKRQQEEAANPRSAS